MTSQITWQNVKTILGIKDLFEYKEFLQHCPNLNNYVCIQPSSMTNCGFDFSIYSVIFHVSQGHVGMRETFPFLFFSIQPSSMTNCGFDFSIYDYSNLKYEEEMKQSSEAPINIDSPPRVSFQTIQDNKNEGY